MAVILPYINIVRKIEKFSWQKIDEIIRQSISLSREKPCYIEVSDADSQWYLFFREKQIYAAGNIKNQQFNNSTIKDFFLTCSEMQSPTLTWCEFNNKILHSLLILFQKKPSIKILTSLVDLDKLLDKIEEEDKSCIVNASQDEFLAILRYEKGRVTALCHEHSHPYPKEETFREDFLVKIYTLSAEKHLLINLYEDLLVRFATDAKMIDDTFHGIFSHLFLSKPPVVILQLKGKELARWRLEKPRTTIGRTPENDIAIDNLAVSRLHATLEEDKGSYFIVDCDSLNGTMLNGQRIGRSRLRHGDEISIGKHKLLFRKQDGRTLPGNTLAGDYDQTFIISPEERTDAILPGPASTAAPEAIITGEKRHAPRLLEKTPNGDRVIELLKPSLILGSDRSADITIEGFLVAGRHAELVRQGDRYIIKHLKGMRKVRVGGKAVSESILKPNDKIKIANKEFIYLE